MSKKEKEKWMTVSLGNSLASEGFFIFFYFILLVDLWGAQPCLWDPE